MVHVCSREDASRGSEPGVSYPKHKGGEEESAGRVEQVETSIRGDL